MYEIHILTTRAFAPRRTRRSAHVISIKVLMSMHCGICFHPMNQNMSLPQIGLKNKNNAIQGGNCILETPYREPAVLGSREQKYDTTSDWLGP